MCSPEISRFSGFMLSVKEKRALVTPHHLTRGQNLGPRSDNQGQSKAVKLVGEKKRQQI